jgi:hypothetical protein
MPVHNLHLLVLNEGGALGSLGLMAMLLSMGLASLLIWRRHRLDGAACAAITAAFLIYTMSIPHMYARIWIGPLLIVFAMAFARYERATRFDGSIAATNKSVRESLRATVLAPWQLPDRPRELRLARCIRERLHAVCTRHSARIRFYEAASAA